MIGDAWLGGRDSVAGVLLAWEGNRAPGREECQYWSPAFGSPSSHRTGPDGTCCALVTSGFLTAVNTTPEPSRRSFPRN